MVEGHHLKYTNDKEFADRCMEVLYNGVMFFGHLEEVSKKIEKNWAYANYSRDSHTQTKHLLSERGLASICRDNDLPFSVRNIKFSTLTEEALKEIAQELGLPYDRKHVKIEVN